MNFLIVVYLFTCANILTFIRITKEVAAGNLEPESSAKSAGKREQSLSEAKFEEKVEQSSSEEEEALDDLARNGSVKKLYKIYNEDEHQRRLDNTVLNEMMSFANAFIDGIKIYPEGMFMECTVRQLLNLCRRTWIMYLLRKNESNINTVKRYEKLLSVKNIEKGPKFYETVFYGRYSPRELFMIGCKLQKKSENTDSFDVYIIPHKTPNSYYIVRHLTPPGSNKPVCILFSLVENVTPPEDSGLKSCIAKLCC